MLPTIHQRLLTIWVRQLKTVEDLTEDEGYDGDRKEDIGEQVWIRRGHARIVHDQVEASQVVAVTHCARAVAQGNIQLATSGRPLLGCQVPKTTLPVERKALLREKFSHFDKSLKQPGKK